MNPQVLTVQQFRSIKPIAIIIINNHVTLFRNISLLTALQSNNRVVDQIRSKTPFPRCIALTTLEMGNVSCHRPASFTNAYRFPNFGVNMTTLLRENFD